jgi:hypothetical protein
VEDGGEAADWKPWPSQSGRILAVAHWLNDKRRGVWEPRKTAWVEQLCATWDPAIQGAGRRRRYFAAVQLGHSMLQQRG